MLKYIGNSQFEGCVDLTNVGAAPLVEITCGYRTCKLEDANLMYEAACKYIEQFAGGRKVTTYNVIQNCCSETDKQGVEYINTVILQINIE